MIEVKFAKISGRRRKYHISTDDDDDKIYQKSPKDYIILRSALLLVAFSLGRYFNKSATSGGGK